MSVKIKERSGESKICYKKFPSSDENWVEKNGKKYYSTPLSWMLLHRFIQKH